jgi:hypothetical protein
MVEGFIAWLKVAVTTAFGQEVLELRGGLTEPTVGAVKTAVFVVQQPAISRIATNPRAQHVHLRDLMLITLHLRRQGELCQDGMQSMARKTEPTRKMNQKIAFLQRNQDLVLVLLIRYWRLLPS